MSRILLVTYDLHSPGQNYNDILDSIREFDHIQLSESSYAIFTNKAISVIFRKYFEPHLDYNDEFHIIKLTRPYKSYGNPEVEEWLRKHFPRCS